MDQKSDCIHRKLPDKPEKPNKPWHRCSISERVYDASNDRLTEMKEIKDNLLQLKSPDTGRKIKRGGSVWRKKWKVYYSLTLITRVRPKN
mmetsp:Transcript_6089/g.14696  ORF Transcript_6089/g.14696 Transcript_6089/m.14696 type:complete len:90 (-) Transcript_6089:5-274(-)